MNVILFCASGYSSRMLIGSLRKYCYENHIDLQFASNPISEFEEEINTDYDLILMAPQIQYKYEDIAKRATIPIICIQAFDYAVGNAENIVKLIQEKIFV